MLERPFFRDITRPADAGISALVKGGGWKPTDLGASLYDLWDAEDAASLTLVGAAVSAWASKKNAYSAAQALGASRPIFSATSFNSRPGVTFDSLDDELTYAGVGILPIGSDPCEIWALVDQTALVADATFRVLCAYGGTTSQTRRTLQRATGSGNNTALITVGDGATTVSPLSNGFGGRCVVRAVISSTASRIDLNGIAGTPSNVVPATSNTRLRFGANNGNTAANFFQGVLSLLAFTAPLSAGDAAKMTTYLKARGGIA